MIAVLNSLHSNHYGIDHAETLRTSASVRRKQEGVGKNVNFYALYVEKIFYC